MAVPRHAFFLWLASKNRLATRDMLKWGYPGDTTCVLCRNCLGSRYHLFFSCPFTDRIWAHIMRLCLIFNPVTSWNEIVDWGLKNWKAKSLRAVLFKLAWGAALYHLWVQRNNHIQGGHLKTEESLLQGIELEVRLRVAGGAHFKNSILNRALCYSWGVSESSLLYKIKWYWYLVYFLVEMWFSWKFSLAHQKKMPQKVLNATISIWMVSTHVGFLFWKWEPHICI